MSQNYNDDLTLNTDIPPHLTRGRNSKIDFWYSDRGVFNNNTPEAERSELGFIEQIQKKN